MSHSERFVPVIIALVKKTSGRVLELLGLMQARVDWTGPELAERLGVTDRTVRNDVARLRELGYPVDATRGRDGHYRLGVGAKLPPLLLDDEEAVAVAVGPAHRDRRCRLRGERRPGAGQARARAARPVAPSAGRAPGRHQRRTGQHRLQRRGPGGRPGRAHRDRRRDPRPPAACGRSTATTSGSRSSPTGSWPGSAGGTSSAATRHPAVGAVPGRLADTAHSRRAAASRRPRSPAT